MAQTLCSEPREASVILLYNRRIWIRKTEVSKFTKLEELEPGSQNCSLYVMSVPSLCSVENLFKFALTL